LHYTTDALGELVVHHEVVDVFLGSGQFQLARQHGHHERRTPGTLPQPPTFTLREQQSSPTRPRPRDAGTPQLTDTQSSR